MNQPSSDLRQELDEVLQSPGQPLDSTTRGAMESWFNYDFSKVKVHTDSRAGQSAEDVGALAYTVRNNIVFGNGQYSPHTQIGQQLLTHELTHVVQQDMSNTQDGFVIGQPSNALEMQADQVSQAQATGKESPISSRVASQPIPNIQLKMSDKKEAQSLGEIAERDEVEDGDSPPGSLFPVEKEPELADEIEEYEDASFVKLGIQSKKKSPSKQKGPKPKQKGPKLNRDLAEVPAGPSPWWVPSWWRSPSSSWSWWITRVDIDLTSQSLKFTRSDKIPTKSVPISSGKGLPDTTTDPCEDPNKPDTNCTPTGSFKPDMKGDEGYTNSKGDRMSWYVQFLASRGIGIHNSQPVTGKPESHGCVRVNSITAKDINEHVTSDTDIVVAGKAPTHPWHK